MKTFIVMAGIFLTGITEVAWAQSVSMQSLPEQFAQCQSLLRVKQDLPCRCDQVEMLASALLRRAEKAEEDVAQLKAQVADMKKSPEKFREPAAQEDQK